MHVFGRSVAACSILAAACYLALGLVEGDEVKDTEQTDGSDSERMRVKEGESASAYVSHRPFV